MTQRYLNVTEAAQYLGSTVDAVRWRIRKGDLPFIRDRGRIHFDRDDLDRYMKAHRLAPDEPRRGHHG